MVYVDASKCTGCGVCVPSCPKQAISLADGTASIDGAACDQCGRCLDLCPTAAIRSVGEALPVRVAGVRPYPLAQPAEPERRPALINQVLSRVAPVALDVAVALLDRWLARRDQTSVTASAADLGLARSLALGSGRRMRRRHGRPW